MLVNAAGPPVFHLGSSAGGAELCGDQLDLAVRAFRRDFRFVGERMRDESAVAPCKVEAWAVIAVLHFLGVEAVGLAKA